MNLAAGQVAIEPPRGLNIRTIWCLRNCSKNRLYVLRIEAFSPDLTSVKLHPDGNLVFEFNELCRLCFCYLDTRRQKTFQTECASAIVTTMRWVLRSKIHKAVVTQAELSYVGSITIDSELLEMTGMIPGEKVLVVSNTSGARLETYIIEGEKGSGVICMNGAAAHLIRKGEEIIIMGFELADQHVTPKMVLVDEKNRFRSWLYPNTKTLSDNVVMAGE